MADVENTSGIKYTPGNRTGVQSTFATAGMVIEDVDQPAGGRRFRFMIPADTSVENLSPELAAALGQWLIWQAARRSE